MGAAYGNSSENVRGCVKWPSLSVFEFKTFTHSMAIWLKIKIQIQKARLHLPSLTLSH